ncbi:hypothetical protein H6F93_26310 [Leptolyngbya sp. FACHB-671]|nr:hypothetical protein [Leptolyngbya sp. FACHB-671]
MNYSLFLGYLNGERRWSGKNTVWDEYQVSKAICAGEPSLGLKMKALQHWVDSKIKVSISLNSAEIRIRASFAEDDVPCIN